MEEQGNKGWVQQEGLYMYNNRRLDIIYEFDMVLGYYIKRGMVKYLEENYSEVKYYWGVQRLRIETEGKVYQGVIIEVTDNVIKCYKKYREKDYEYIYHRFDDTVMVYDGYKYCDVINEYDMLLNKILEPLAKIIRDIKKLGTMEDYHTITTIREDTKMTPTNLNKWIVAIEQMGKDIAKYYDLKVEVECYYYHTYEFYSYGRVGTVTIDLPDGESVALDYNQLEDKVKIVTTNYDSLEGLDEILSVGYRVHEILGYTIYDRRSLQGGVKRYNETMGKKMKEMMKKQKGRGMVDGKK